LRNKKNNRISSSIRRIDAVDTTSSVTSKEGNSSTIQSANELNSTASTPLKDDDGIKTDVSMVDNCGSSSSRSSSSSSSSSSSTRGDAKDNASYGMSSYESSKFNSSKSSNNAVNHDHCDVKQDQGPSSVNSRKNTDRFTALMLARREGGSDDDGDDRVMDHKRSKI
jgi:hypothetical protein